MSKHRILILAVLFIFPVTCFAFQDQERKSVVIKNVNVLPMDSERVLKNQNVVIENGKIVAIGSPDKIKTNGAKIIDGTGKYLLPGLFDGHIHLRQADEKGLIQYLSAGITTAREMNGRPFLLEWRDKIKKGELLGPTLYVASPTIGNFSSPKEGYPTPKTPEDADMVVKKFGEQGYDWIKVYSFVPRDIYFALIRAARKYKIPIGGHPPIEINFQESLQMKSIEHLLGYVDPIMTPEAKELDEKDLRGVFHAVEIQEDKLPELAKKTKAAGVWNCPTVLFFDHRVPTERARQAWGKPELRKLGHQNRIKILRALYKAKANLLVCTDSDAGTDLFADSIYEEMGNMREAGLTPYEILKAATKNGAVFLNSNEFGTIDVGKRADLLMVECNPLKNIKCVEKQTGVMVRGRWITKQAFNKLLGK